ncbi:MAG: hypothetical protein AB8C02_05030 [Halioglobus sp.]
MLKSNHSSSVVTAIVPNEAVADVTTALHDKMNMGVLQWDARGTLLQEQWWRRWVPPISPSKVALQLLAANDDVDSIERTIIQTAKLDKQATGAVFSSPCALTYFGEGFSAWQIEEDSAEESTLNSANSVGSLDENLSAIYCVVDHQSSDRVCAAAINAGAHGPVVYYSEGRGLRDRLGWLRITKEHEKEVLLVVAQNTDADRIFDAMAQAGNLYMPGRGFMYSLPVSKGMFNLRSRVSQSHHDASMQQIISAIDHIAGHNHWRDGPTKNTVVDGSTQGSSHGPAEYLNNQVCLSVICRRDESSSLINMMLDSGAPGLNFTHARFSDAHIEEQLGGACISDEYAMLRCVTHADTAEKVCHLLESEAGERDIADFCAHIVQAPRVASYVPGKRNYRAA